MDKDNRGVSVRYVPAHYGPIRAGTIVDFNEVTVPQTYDTKENRETLLRDVAVGDKVIVTVAGDDRSFTTRYVGDGKVAMFGMKHKRVAATMADLSDPRITVTGKISIDFNREEERRKITTYFDQLVPNSSGVWVDGRQMSFVAKHKDRRSIVVSDQEGHMITVDKRHVYAWKLAEDDYNDQHKPKATVVKDNAVTKGSSSIKFGENHLPEITEAQMVEHIITHLDKLGVDWTGMAYGMYDGPAIEQVTVEGRHTCVLAVLQMLMVHAKWFDIKDHNIDLVHLKGTMQTRARHIGGLMADSWGTLNLHDADKLRNYLADLARTVQVKGGKNIEVVDGAYLGNDTSLAPPQLLLLENITEDLVAGRDSVVWGVTFTDNRGNQGQSLTGHQRMIDRVATVTEEGQRKAYVHVVDPLSGPLWLRLESVVGRISPRGFRATGENRRERNRINIDDIKRKRK